MSRECIPDLSFKCHTHVIAGNDFYNKLLCLLSGCLLSFLCRFLVLPPLLCDINVMHFNKLPNGSNNLEKVYGMFFLEAHASLELTVSLTPSVFSQSVSHTVIFCSSKFNMLSSSFLQNSTKFSQYSLKFL